MTYSRCAAGNRSLRERLEGTPSVAAWFERVKSQPGFLGPVPPYFANAHVR
ncbi:hypothetical protein [Corallococcus exiguus]|uniref:hypothetical protein n=1 Tax=Corallococcus exiguus TaxID=83462 RepID=UPI001C26EF52|nr:hypothetical protein [Corallococcus exiguus]NRD54551.1 hypothetical protein [Corallococcus exiguus]